MYEAPGLRSFHVKRTTPPGLAFLDAALNRLAEQDLLRERPAPLDPDQLSFCSNDYLGLASRPGPRAPSGAGASRLVSGERSEHEELEGCVSELVGLPAALAFSSGYAANVGVITALAGPGDTIVSDALNHASIVDGARLSRARIEVVSHLDFAAVEGALRRSRRTAGGGRSLVVTESYFSMDADSPDLGELRRICDDHGAALIVDEAHAIGVLGPEGRGLCRGAGMVPDALVGTFGKAFGAAGAFVAGCPALVQWLWNRARTFVFSTGMSPTVALAARDGIRTAAREPDRRERVLAAARQLRQGLQDLGITVGGYGPIIPWILGDPGKAVRVAGALREAGIHVAAIRPPSVPIGTARLRITVTAAHREADVARALRVVSEILHLEGP